MHIILKILFTVIIMVVMTGISIMVIQKLRDKNCYSVKRFNGETRKYPVNSVMDKIGWTVLGLVIELFCLGIIFGYIWV